MTIYGRVNHIVPFCFCYCTFAHRGSGHYIRAANPQVLYSLYSQAFTTINLQFETRQKNSLIESMTSTSPLRYPGGKARFTNFIWEAITTSEEQTRLFIEPFCGGAGAAIALLESGKVKRIALNDVDPLVAHFWQVVFGKSNTTDDDINWLIHSVETAELSTTEWRRQKELVPTNVREFAWKCLYLNRTSFNGILHKSGPVGGWGQTNRTVAARFNAEKIAKRLRELYKLRHKVVRVECEDWQQ